MVRKLELHESFLHIPNFLHAPECKRLFLAYVIQLYRMPVDECLVVVI